MKGKPKVGFVVIRHPLEEGGEHAPRIFSEGVKALQAAGFDVVGAQSFVEDPVSAVAVGRLFYEQRVPVIVLAAATWSADPLVLDLLEESNVPIVTWALPGMNTGSMCGCQQLCYVLKELGRRYRFVYGPMDDASTLRQVSGYVAAANVAAELRKARMGLLGYRIGGMTEVTFDELELKGLLGPRTIHYGLDAVSKAMTQVSETDALGTWRERLGHVKRISVTETEKVQSMRAYLTLRRLARQDGLSGMAVECYPSFMGQFCVAASLLADEDILIGCEGDMNSTVAMLILSRLTDGPVHNTDSLGVDLKEQSIVYSHCGAGSMSLAACPDDIELAHVRLMHEGACVLFCGKPGPVTLVNLVGRRGTYRLGVATGHAISTGMVFAGNPTKVVIEGGAQRHLEAVAREGLGHHWMIGYGDARESLSEFCGLLGIPMVSC